MTAAEALDAILARYGCVELVKAVREEMERAAAFMQCCIAAGGDLIAERDKLRDDLAAARALVDTYADEVDALRPVLPPFGADNGKAWHEAVREQEQDLAAARALLLAYPGATYANSDLIQWEQLRLAALAEKDAPK
jgi:hypothetical protein